MTRRTRQGLRDAVPDILIEKGWTQKQLACAAGIDPGYLCRVLRGDGRVAPELASRVAAALDLPNDYFPECRERAVIEAVRNDPRLRDRLYTSLRRASVAR